MFCWTLSNRYDTSPSSSPLQFTNILADYYNCRSTETYLVHLTHIVLSKPAKVNCILQVDCSLTKGRYVGSRLLSSLGLATLTQGRRTVGLSPFTQLQEAALGRVANVLLVPLETCVPFEEGTDVYIDLQFSNAFLPRAVYTRG